MKNRVLLCKILKPITFDPYCTHVETILKPFDGIAILVIAFYAHLFCCPHFVEVKTSMNAVMSRV